MLYWKPDHTRLAVGLIFFVSTFFSAVNLLTDCWATLILKHRKDVIRFDEMKGVLALLGIYFVRSPTSNFFLGTLTQQTIISIQRHLIKYQKQIKVHFQMEKIKSKRTACLYCSLKMSSEKWFLCSCRIWILWSIFSTKKAVVSRQKDPPLKKNKS